MAAFGCALICSPTTLSLGERFIPAIELWLTELFCPAKTPLDLPRMDDPLAVPETPGLSTYTAL